MDICDTKYPIVLVHGLGYSDDECTNYWGNIPQVLRANGAKVFFGEQSSNGKISENALELKNRILRLCEEEKTEKVNIIAHSKGGIDSRFMISKLGMAERVASLTTIATPHRGVVQIDSVKDKSQMLLNRIYDLFSIMVKIDGGERPDGYGVYEQLSCDYMEVFNELVPDDERVYYQSWACDMKSRKIDPAFNVFYEMIYKIKGPNDGLVSVWSAKWGNFRGVYTGPKDSGLSHGMASGGRMKIMEKKDLGEVAPWYLDMVKDLKEMGY